MCRNFSFSDVHVEGARVIAEACAECGVKQLIHFSAVGADQESTSTFLQSKVGVIHNLDDLYQMKYMQ